MVRVTISGDESVLAGLDLSFAQHVRRPTVGMRIVILKDRAEVEDLGARLAKGFTYQVDEPDLEAVLSEWML
jgi:hypothetical protein